MVLDVDGWDILLLGANGQVGNDLQRALAPLGEVTALDYPEIDFSQPESLRSLVRERAPQIIVNAAAYTAVDKAESEQDKCLAVNARAPGVLAEEAESLGAILVHYSTDYVFDGTKSSPYFEADAPCPLSTYGRTKLEGERAVAACTRHLIFRTSWVYGVHGHNFLKTILRLASERDSLRIVGDQQGAPTTSVLLAEVPAIILRAMAGADASDPRWGLYHLVASGVTSWHGFAQTIVWRASELGWALKATPQNVQAITTAEYPTPAARPASSRLDTAKLRSTFGLEFSDWTVGLEAVLTDLAKGAVR